MPELITEDEIRRYDSLWKKQRLWAGGAEERRSFEEIIEDPKLQFPETTTQRRKGLLDLIPMGGPAEQLKDSVHFVTESLTKTIQGVRDAAHNIIPKQDPKSPAYLAASAVSPLIHTFVPIETDTEHGRRLQASQDALVNSGLGIAFLGRGVELKGNFKEKLGPRGEQSLIKLMNDPDIEVGSKAFESELANIGTDLASFFIPYMGTLKLLNGVSFLSKVASKTANHKWNKAFNYSRSAVENILKQTGAISAGVSLAFDPYEDNTLAWQLAELIDPDDDGLTKLVLDSLSVDADDSVATAYGKLIASEALIGVPLLMTGAVTRAGLTAGRSAIANRMTPEAIVELAAKMEARQIVRRTAQVKKESLDDQSVERVLSWSADDDLGFGKKAWQWTQWQSTKHLTPRGGMTHQMFELFTQAKNNERNAERFIKREVSLMDEAVEDLVYVAKEEGAGNVRGKIWNDLNDVIMDKKPVEVLHPRLQPSALKIRGTIDNLTREILASPTIPKHDYITAEGGDQELSELVKDWAGQNNWKLDDAIEATQVVNNKNAFETLIEEGDTIVLPTLRAVMEHNLESYMRRAFKIHSAGGTLGQVAKRGIEHLIPGVTPTTRIGWTPPSRAKKETFDYLMNQANGNFDSMVDTMGIADDFVEIEKLLYNQYPRAVSRIQDELSDAFTQAREAGEEFSQEDATLAIRQRLFEDITHTRMNEILTSNAGDGSLTDTLLNQSYLFGRSMSNTGKSIFTRREDIADPILEFMGEIKDPRFRTLDTVYRMSHWIEQDKFLRKLRQIGEGVYLDTAASFNPRFTATIDMPTTALHGMKTTPEIETILSSAHNTINQDNPLMRFVVNPMIARPKGWAQRAATTWNPMTHARNIGGSVLMHMGNGWGPTEMWPSLKEVWADLHALPEKEMDDLLRYYNSLGIIHSSVMTQQIQELVGDAGLGASFRDADSFWNHKLIQQPVKAVKLAADKVDEFYQAEDSIFKIMAFKKERDFRLGAFADELADGTKTRAMIEQEAASIVKNTMPNYGYIPRSIRNLRYVPFGNFFSFRFEEMRTGWNIAAQAIEELSDPRTRMRGARRMGGFVGSVLVGGSGYTMMHNIVNNITREEEVAVRQTATDWSRGANIAITRGEDGKPSGYFDISNNMPYDAWQRWLPTLMKNISEGKYNKDSLMKSWTMAGLETIADYGQPFIQEDIYGKNILDLLFRGGRDIDGREIWAGDFLDRPIANFNTAVQHVLKSFVPGGVKSFNRIYKGFTGDFQDYYKDYNPWHDLAGTFSGFRYIPINHELTIKTNGVDFKEGMGDANAVFTSYMTTEAPEEDIYEGYDEADTLRRKAFQRMGQVVQGAMRLGATENEVKRYLTKIDIAKKDQYALILNRYNPLPLTQDTFEKIANRSRRYRRGDMVRIQDTLKKMQSKSQTYNLLEEFPDLPGPLRRWLETEKERLDKGGIRQRKATGGVVTPTIPRASKEPDERINKVTGVPYNQTAGIAYQDKEDRPYAPTTNP